jgi:hypothetical protein
MEGIPAIVFLPANRICGLCGEAVKDELFRSDQIRAVKDELFTSDRLIGMLLSTS